MDVSLLRRTAPRTAARPLSDALRDQRPGRSSGGLAQPLLAFAVAMLVTALALPRDHGPALPADGLRPVHAPGAPSANGAARGSDVADVAASGAGTGAGTSAASVVPGDGGTVRTP